jgi:micrococcal nuclease
VTLGRIYARFLVYVYLEDGTFVNAWLVEHEYAQMMTLSPDVKCHNLFLKPGAKEQKWEMSR